MTTYSVRLYVQPFGKARARTGQGRTFVDKKTLEKMDTLASLLSASGLPRFSHRALTIAWIPLFPRTKEMKAVRRDGTFKYCSERIPHTTRPDRDNIDKALLDAMQNLAMLDDDCKVWGGTVFKMYVGWDPDTKEWEHPGFELAITDNGPADPKLW